MAKRYVDPGSIMDALDAYYEEGGWYDYWKDNSKTIFTRRNDDGVLHDHYPDGTARAQGEGGPSFIAVFLAFGAILAVIGGGMLWLLGMFGG